MAANRMQRIFQLRSSEKSFVSRISPRNPCLPAIIIFIFDYCKIYLIHNKRKNFVELIELGEVFALEKFPSQREATHTLQRWRIFQSWQKFGRGTNFAWQNSEAVVPNRLILVIFSDPAKWGRIASAKFKKDFYYIGRSPTNLSH